MKNNGLEQPAHASTSAAVQSNVVYPAPGMSTRRFEYRAAPDKRSSLGCAVERRCLPAGANPARQLSLQPVVIGAIVEVTKRLKPSV